MITLHGGRDLTLRAFRPDEIDAALEQVAAAELASGDREAVSRKRERLERSGTRTDWEVWFAIEAEGRLVGDIQGRCSDHAMPPGVWELGIELWDEKDRGRGIGHDACAMLVSYLFDRESAIRVQATTDVDNAAMRRTLERFGFGFEGVLRGFMPGAQGPPRDYAMYGMTADDWMEMRNGWTRTS